MNFPTLEELLTLRAGARHLKWQARGAAQALLLGSHRSARHGRGMEIEEVRPYVSGDDRRSIDWRVTARRGRLHTKLFREERERPVWLLVDLSASMFFGSRVQLKSMVAVRAAALLAWSAAFAGDRIGALIGDGEQTRVLPLRSREAGVLPLLNALVELQPRKATQAVHEFGAPAVQALAPLVRPGSVVVALSDFHAPALRSQAQWTAWSAHSDCRWIWIADALERGALPDGRYLAGFNGRIAALDGAVVRAAWLARWAQRAASIEELAGNLRIAVQRLDTAQDIAAALASTVTPKVRAA